MNRYDRGYGRGRSEGGWSGAGRYGSDYGDDYAGTGRERLMRRMQRMRSGGGYDRGVFGGQGAAYDRGVYGSTYPTFGGTPRGSQQGMYYGGQQQRGWGSERGFRGGFSYDTGDYGSGYARQGGRWGGAQMGRGGMMGGRGAYDRMRGYGGGYDQFAREPFIPEIAYQRHPELSRQPLYPGIGWPSHEPVPVNEPQRSDNEIEEEVRANLYQDDWVDADRIDVEVQDAVVTLRGEVDDFLEARYAWDDAWEATGVHGVINQITVRTDREPTPHHDLFPQSEMPE
jgi:hypothetical protein